MKTTVFLLLILSGVCSAQYVTRIDVIYTLPTNPIPQHKYIYQDSVRVYADGQWFVMGHKSNLAYATTDFGGGTVTSLWEKDASGNMKPKSTTDTDSNWELDSQGNIRPK